MKKSEVSGQGPGARGQGTGTRGPWLAVAGAVLLLAGCAAPKPQFTDEDWVSHVTTGRGCYERGDLRRAADAFARAQQRARALDDADALAVAAVNRAVCLLPLDRSKEALADVREALADERVSAPRQAELRVAAARAELAAGRSEQARAEADLAMEYGLSPILRAQAVLAKAGAGIADHDAPAAGRILQSVSPAEWAALPARLRAEQAELEARGAATLESPGEALEWQDQAVEHWRTAGRLPEMARALAEAGRMAQAAGDLPGACDRLRRAAKSLWAQEAHDEAVRTLEEAVECAQRMDDPDVGEKLAELLVTFRTEWRLKGHVETEAADE